MTRVSWLSDRRHRAGFTPASYVVIALPAIVSHLECGTGHKCEDLVDLASLIASRVEIL